MSQQERTKPYRLKELAEETGLAYITLWRAAQAGEIETVKLGRAVLIPAAEAHRLIYGQERK